MTAYSPASAFILQEYAVSSEPESLSWFVVFCAHRAEFAIVDGLREGGITSYCPAETRWRVSPKNRIRTRLALLPGYLFVGLQRDWHGDFPFPAVKGVDGVIGILGVAGAPAEIPYGAPDPEFDRSNLRREDRPVTIGELKALEDAGAFDLTRDNGLSEAAKRKARKIVKSFADLARALAQPEAA